MQRSTTQTATPTLNSPAETSDTRSPARTETSAVEPGKQPRQLTLRHARAVRGHARTLFRPTRRSYHHIALAWCRTQERHQLVVCSLAVHKVFLSISSSHMVEPDDEVIDVMSSNPRRVQHSHDRQR